MLLSNSEKIFESGSISESKLTSNGTTTPRQNVKYTKKKPFMQEPQK